MSYSQTNSVIECRALSKSFGRGQAIVQVLRDVTLALVPGECCALLGPSGSGKTTLLSILGCLLAPSRGDVLLGGQRIDYARQDRLTWLRKSRIGYVFQHAHLLPFLSVYENLCVVGRNAGLATATLRSRIEQLVDELEIEHQLHHRADQLSGGQRQRAAVARALLHQPNVLLADEPTGALDADQGSKVARVLTDQARRNGAALIVVTHDTRIVDAFDRVLRIESGRLAG